MGCCLWGGTESDTTEATQQQQQQLKNIVLRRASCEFSPCESPWLPPESVLVCSPGANFLWRHHYRMKDWEVCNAKGSVAPGNYSQCRMHFVG